MPVAVAALAIAVTLSYDKPWPNVCAGLPVPVDRIAMEDQITTIRDFIINPRRQHRLLKNKALWSQLCSSLDVIGDTELAIASYEAGESGSSVGARYLAVYGLLQALSVQQDAALHLSESLEIPNAIHNYPRLKEIREIRIESVGHPTKKGTKKGEPTSHHVIVRATLTPAGFSLLSHYSDGRFEFKDVSIPELIGDQRRYVSDIVATVIRKLEQEEASHKERFRMEKLAAAFPPALNYCFEKVFEGATESEHAAVGVAGLKAIQGALQEFREALARRGIELDTYDSISYAYELLEYPLGELEGFFRSARGAGVSNINDKTAYIFAYFVRGQVAKLRDVAQEIDNEYSS